MDRSIAFAGLLAAGILASTTSAAASRTLTVSGGFADTCCAEGVSRATGLQPGDGVSVYVDWENQKEMAAFQRWTVTPANADLGGGVNAYSSETTIVMPDLIELEN